ncbi:ABC transporter permease [Occallatibacter riparius]|uniref:ABC transporter permease n=1 Tax=Occallatibacter riparius TaxID=1002689 RepID=A0A9J7BWD8_9BACT|nr:ABC transporter permease [Occallatibacter riparius]UWZ85325.1 ABC transporter permease [Occallatibacter riparius]
MSWLERIFRRRSLYDELDEEVREHIEEKTEQLMRLENLSRVEARHAAVRAFGNPTLVQTRSREVWQWPKLESFVADLRLALRRLRKSPGFGITVLLTLAIGIGANTAVFTVVDSILLKPLPYPQPEQLVAVWLHAPGAAGLTNFAEGLRLSPSMYLTFAEHNRTFKSIGVWISGTANVTGIAKPEEVKATYISDGVLQAFDVPPAAGRWILTADQVPHTHEVAMLSYGYWQRRFGGDASVIGRSIQVDSHTREIIGVMPRGFEVMNQDFDVLIPFAFDPRHQILAGFGYNGIGRMKPGVTVGEADADIARMLNIWMDSWSNEDSGGGGHFYETWKISGAIRPMKQEVIGNIGSVLWVVMGTIGVVMLIACTNVANLLLVRAEGRQQELAIRTALGAGRTRIAREVLTECVLLALIGGVAGIGIAMAGLRLLAAIGPAKLPRVHEISFDARSIAFTLGLSLFSALLFGTIAAMKSMRPNTSLAHASAGRTASVSRDRQRGRNVLVIAQVAMAMVLLISAVLMIRTLAALRDVDPGFADANHVQTLRIAIPQQLIPDAQMTLRLENSIADKLAAIPGVDSAGLVRDVPMDEIDPAWNNIFIEGKDDRAGSAPMRLFNYVSPGYFHTQGTRLVAGRDYAWDDIYGLRSVGIVSENLARESWGSAQAAIGKRFRIMPTQAWIEVVGVAQDVHQNGVDEESPATVYWPVMVKVPWANNAIDTQRFVTFVLHSDRAGTDSLRGEIQQAVWQVNGNLPVASMQTQGDLYSRSMARTSFTLVMLAIAGAMALALSLIGIYGVISYAVSQRTREIGIRMALGARKSELRWMFVRSALALTGIGVVIGLGAAAGVARMLKALLFGVSPLDPISFAAVPFLLAAASALASFVPASRVASVNPVDALKDE